MIEDFMRIKDGLLEIETRMNETNPTPDREELRQAVLVLQSSMILLTEIVYRHVEFDEPMHGKIS